METEKINTGRLIIAALVVVLLDIVLMELFQQFKISVYAKIALVRLIEIVSLLIVVEKTGIGLAAVGLSGKTALHGLKRGFFWSFGFGGVVGIGFIILALSGVNPFHLFKTRLPGSEIDILFFFIAGGLIAPVAEEIFFRGVLYGYLRKNGAVFAAITSTVIFAAMHSIGGSVPVVQAVGGLLFAAAYEIEKSLITPIIIHVLGNIAIFTLSLI